MILKHTFHVNSCLPENLEKLLLDFLLGQGLNSFPVMPWAFLLTRSYSTDHFVRTFLCPSGFGLELSLSKWVSEWVSWWGKEWLKGDVMHPKNQLFWASDDFIRQKTVALFDRNSIDHNGLIFTAVPSMNSISPGCTYNSAKEHVGTARKILAACLEVLPDLRGRA